MQRLAFVLVFILALMLVPSALEQSGQAAQSSLWITPFEDGRYIGDALPASISESDFNKLSQSLLGKEATLIILDAGGQSFDSVAIGYYDAKKRDVTPLWSSDLRDELPITFEKVVFEELFIKFTYLPGDKYVSSNFKVGVSASYGSHSANIKAFLVSADLDYFGASLKAGDFILASDSGGGGALSNLSNNDYSDIVFVLRHTPAPLLPTATAFWLLGSGGILGLTWWGFRKGKRGLGV